MFISETTSYVNTVHSYMTAVCEYCTSALLFGVQKITELVLEGRHTGGSGLLSMNTGHQQPESGQQERKLGLHSHRTIHYSDGFSYVEIGLFSAVVCCGGFRSIFIPSKNLYYMHVYCTLCVHQRDCPFCIHHTVQNKMFDRA